MPKKKLNRKHHKNSYINVKNFINQSKDTLGGLFDSDHEFHGENQWVDFIFLSKKERIFWNVEIITARVAFEDKITDIAFTQLNEILGEDWHQKYPLFIEGEQINHEEKILQPIEEKSIPELGGLTWPQWLNNKKIELADSGKYSIHESVVIDKSYQYGRGLHIIKNVENISIDVINKFITEFLENGEQASASSESLTFKSDSLSSVKA
jgi:hypothetical protein